MYRFGGHGLGGVWQGVPLCVGGEQHGIFLLGLGRWTIIAVRVFLQICTLRGLNRHLLDDVVDLVCQADGCHGHLLLVLVVAIALGAFFYSLS